jgi:arylsulfatase A-like enzyme
MAEAVSDPSTTLLFVTADHGEAFGEHGHMFHAFSVYDTLLRVPLIARGPGIAAGRVETSPVQLTDVFATTLAAAGVQPPDGTRGRDLRLPLPAERGLHASYAWPVQMLDLIGEEAEDPAFQRFHRVMRAGIQGRHKIIRDSTGREQVFDVVADPGELHPLEEVDPELRERLRALAGDPARPSRWEVPAEDREQPDWDPAEADALRTLGYLE